MMIVRLFYLVAILGIAAIVLGACATPPAPTAVPTKAAVATVAPTLAPSPAPTTAPTVAPTTAPSPAPTTAPSPAPTTAPTPAAGTGVSATAQITMTLGAGRDGNQPGTVTLIAQGNQTQVVLSIQPGAAGVAQPAHIHEGACPGVGAVKFPLTNVVDGKSTTTVNATLADLLKGGLSINVHKSAAEASVYVACGAIPQGSLIALGPGRDATQPGTIVLVSQGNQTQVFLNLQPGAAGVAQPAHIHEGACPGVGAVKFPLTSVVDGKSVTTVNAALADLFKGDLSVNVHKSATEASVYTACAPLKAPAASGAATSATVQLGPGRDGSQTGTAVLTAKGETTQVVINIQPGASGVAQPAHIHEGACPGVGAVKFPLTSVVDGKSTTVVTSTLDALLKGGYSINVHKSASEAGVYVSCGAIK